MLSFFIDAGCTPSIVFAAVDSLVCTWVEGAFTRVVHDRVFVLVAAGSGAPTAPDHADDVRL